MTTTYKITRDKAARTREEYKRHQAEIKKLLLQIRDGLKRHEQEALQQGCHWGLLGDVNRIEQELAEIRDRLMGLGEYAQ